MTSVALDAFADLTSVPLVVPGGIDRGGLLFDGDLTVDEVAAIWERMTARDADDQAARANLSDLLTNDTTASPLAKAVAAYLLGGAQ